MTLGPGKYDKLATWARLKVGADAIVLIVIGGDQGHGSTMQIHSSFTKEQRLHLVDALRTLIDEMELDIRRLPETKS